MLKQCKIREECVEGSDHFKQGPILSRGLLLAVSTFANSIAAVSDYNADGRTDILIRNTGTGDDIVRLVNGASPR